MDTFKKFGLWLSVILLGPLLLLGVASFAFTRTIGNPTYLKQTFAEAHVYQALGKQIRVESSSDISPKDKARLNQALTAATNDKNMQKVGEQTIDQIFNFLSGETNPDEITINVAPITSKLDQALLAQVEKQLETEIKKCNNLQKSGAEINCKKLEAQRAESDRFVKSAFGKNGVLADGNLTLSDLEELSAPGGVENQNRLGVSDLRRSLEFLATLYQIAQVGIVVCGVFALLCACGIVFLSSDRLRGLRRSGVIMLVNGGVIVIVSVIGSFIAQKGAATFTDSAKNLSDALGVASSQTIADLASYSRILGLAVLIIGMTATAVSSILIKQRSTKLAAPTKTPPVPKTKTM